MRLIFGDSLEKATKGYRTPWLIPALQRNLFKVNLLEIKNGTNEAHFSDEGSIRSPYGAKIELAGIEPLVRFLAKIKRA